MTLRLEYRSDVAILTLDRPHALNALSFGLIEQIGRAFDDVGASSARALLITGAGSKAFCAGADISELQNRDIRAQREGAELGQATFAKLDQLRMASVALINGYAFGGGAELAMACTFRVATANAKIGLPEIKLGLIPGYGGTQRLPKLIGPARALELILSGRALGASEALGMGLINRIVEDMDGALKFIAEFSAHGLLAQQFAREAVHRSMGTPLHAGLRVEADLSTLAYRTADAEEGMRAFLEKRPPRFTDA